MADPGNETEKRFSSIVEAFAGNPAVSHTTAGSRLFGSSSLKVHDKIFAMVSQLAREALEFVGT